MATLAQIRDTITNSLQKGNITSAQVDPVINSVIDIYSSTRFWFNETSYGVTLTIDDAVIPTLPSAGAPFDIRSEIQPGGLTILDSNCRYILDKVSSEEFDQLDCLSKSSRPTCYTYRANQYEVYPKPDKAYTVTFRYLKKYPDLVADGDNNDFTNEARTLIEQKSIAKIILDYLHLSPSDQRALRHEQNANDEFTRHITETNRRNGTNRITPDGVDYYRQEKGRLNYNNYY